MPPVEYSWEVRERAKDLYVVEGLTFPQVAAALTQEFPAPTPSKSQLKRWSDQDKEWEEKHWTPPEREEKAQKGEEGKDWPATRKEFRLALGVIRRDSTLLRAKLISNALGEPDFKKVLSAAMWEKTQQTKNQPGASVPATSGTSAKEPQGAEAIVIKTPQDAVAAIERVLSRHLGDMLGGLKPINLAALKDFKQSLALLDELKAKYLPEETGGETPGLSPEAADKIRRQILGVA